MTDHSLNPPFMLMDGTWLQLGACATCGHSVLFHGLAPWTCQNKDCDCRPPKITSKRPLDRVKAD